MKDLQRRYDEVVRERDELALELRNVREALAQSEARLARQRRPHRARARGEGPSVTEARRRWVELPDEGYGDDPVFRVSYGFVGRAWQLEALDVMLKTIHEACSVGSWITFDVWVDGDGSSPLAVLDSDGAPLDELDPEVWHWLFSGETGADPPAKRPRDVHVAGGVVCVELA